MNDEKEREYEERITALEKRVYALEIYKNQTERDLYNMKVILDRISPKSGLIERYL